MMDAALRAFVRERVGRRSEYCHVREEDAGTLAFQIEHIIAKQHGGTDEMGELAMHQSVPDRFAIFSTAWLADESEFLHQKQSNLRGLAQLVSRQAEKSHSGFVTEVFAALTLGREKLKEDPILMDAYTRFGGIAIRRYDA